MSTNRNGGLSRPEQIVIREIGGIQCVVTINPVTDRMYTNSELGRFVSGKNGTYLELTKTTIKGVDLIGSGFIRVVRL